MAATIESQPPLLRKGRHRWPAAKNRGQTPGRLRSKGVLGIAWIHGVFQAAIYRKQDRLASWASPCPVGTLEDLAKAIDAAIAEMGFRGEDAFLVLEHDELVHQMETAPGFSNKAAREYLRRRVERFEAENAPVVWINQPTASNHREATHLVHLLPRRFYDELNDLLHARRLDLSRVIPLVVPIQQEILRASKDTQQPILVACETGQSTHVVVGRANGEVLFSRCTLLSWRDAPERVAIEINRSLLYAKQQFAAPVERVSLIGGGAATALPEIESKCGGGVTFSTSTGGAIDWLDSVARLPIHHPINLVAGHLQNKRRQRLMRVLLMTLGWVTLAAVCVNAFANHISWQAERALLADLVLREESLHRAHALLSIRNRKAMDHESFIDAVDGATLPPVPGKLLAHITNILPREVVLSEFSVRLDAEKDTWGFRCEGIIVADGETARTIENNLRRQLVRGPIPISITASPPENTRVFVGGMVSEHHRFTLEGAIREN